MAQSKLTEQEQLFVAAFIEEGGNATLAAKQAGYSPESAHNQGYRLKNRPRVAAEIAKRMGRIAEKADVSKERVLEELARIAFANLGDLTRVNADGLPQIYLADATMEQFAALSEVSTSRMIINGEGDEVEKAKIKQHSKLAALDQINRIMGNYNDKLTVVDSREVEELRAGRAKVAAARAAGEGQADV